jgi:hypothetical protein
LNLEAIKNLRSLLNSSEIEICLTYVETDLKKNKQLHLESTRKGSLMISPAKGARTYLTLQHLPTCIAVKSVQITD